jgi:short subunit dehydrogenase-like uncharacterized protein
VPPGTHYVDLANELPAVEHALSQQESAISRGTTAVRVLLPAVSLLSRLSFLRRFAINRLAKVRMSAKEMARQFSWGHCEMEWQDGTKREACLRLPDAQESTIAAVAEIAHRLAVQALPGGAYTPATLFGPSLAVDLGSAFVV